jgi:hypothetical protein
VRRTLNVEYLCEPTLVPSPSIWGICMGRDISKPPALTARAKTLLAGIGTQGWHRLQRSWEIDVSLEVAGFMKGRCMVRTSLQYTAVDVAGVPPAAGVQVVCKSSAEVVPS